MLCLCDKYGHPPFFQKTILLLFESGEAIILWETMFLSEDNNGQYIIDLICLMTLLCLREGGGPPFSPEDMVNILLLFERVETIFRPEHDNGQYTTDSICWIVLLCLRDKGGHPPLC